jgi:hypothetical protein
MEEEMGKINDVVGKNKTQCILKNEKIIGSLKKNTGMVMLIHNHLVKPGKLNDLGNIVMPEIPER